MNFFYYLLIMLFLPTAISAQSGVYKTSKDFKEHKLSQECESINMEMLVGKYYIILINGKDKEKIMLKGSGIWGFRRGMTDYRIIEDLPRAIATKGEIWVYSGYFDRIDLDKDKDTSYYKTSTTYPYASKGIDGPLILLKSQKDMFNLMNPAVVGQVKTALNKFQVSFYLEDTIDYYNSLRPNYISSRFKKFYLNDLNKTANGHRSVSF